MEKDKAIRVTGGDETKESDDNRNIEEKTLKEIREEFKGTVLKFIEDDHILLLTGKAIENDDRYRFEQHLSARTKVHDRAVLVGRKQVANVRDKILVVCHVKGKIGWV